MSDYLNTFFFGIYPYIAIVVFLLGSIVRFDREQYTWKSESSQLLKRGYLRLGSNLFHIGILGIFVGHFIGLLTPVTIWHAFGISAHAKQLLAIGMGGVFGIAMLAGLALLIARRLGEPRIRATTKTSDMVVLWLLLIQLLLGLGTLPVSAAHLDGAEMVKLMTWAQQVVTFQGTAPSYVADSSIVFKLHIILGLTIFLVFPFTRLVHAWSGFAAIAYLGRAYQLVRGR